MATNKFVISDKNFLEEARKAWKKYAVTILEELGYSVALTEKEKEIIPSKCIFCKSENVKVIHDGILNLDHVECQSCGMSGPQNVSKDEAIKWWNKIYMYHKER